MTNWRKGLAALAVTTALVGGYSAAAYAQTSDSSTSDSSASTSDSSTTQQSDNSQSTPTGNADQPQAPAGDSANCPNM